jgi:hypothetical protein
MDIKVVAPDEAATAIRSGNWRGQGRIGGCLDLSNFAGIALPNGLHCHDLNLRNAAVTRLPDDLRIDSRLVLDECSALADLPNGLAAGSISARNCTSLRALPEGITTWFLDLTGATLFETWPKHGIIQNGSLILRGCTRVKSLPDWVERLAQLDVSGCVSLNALPDNLKVTSWIDLAGTGITRLPAGLRDVSLRWRGVSINERIAFHPNQLSAREVLEEPNTERRRVMIERMGYLRFSQESGARVIDRDTDPGGERQLLAIEIRGDETIVGLLCHCPSTRRQYFLRVPPSTRTCRQAAAWMAGFEDESLYHPKIET